MLTMAYRRKYKKRSRTYKRKAKKQGGMSIADMATAGFTMAKKLVRLINVETKHYDTQTIGNCINTGTILDLCDPDQGLDQDERQGDSIKPLRLTVRGQVYANALGNDVQNIRVIIFRFKDENGATVTVNDVLNSATTGTASAPWAAKAWDNRFHSKILYDRLFTVSRIIANNTGIPNSCAFKIQKKLFGHINWADSTTTQEGGGLYMLVISDATTNGPAYQYVTRTTYTDN